MGAALGGVGGDGRRVFKARSFKRAPAQAIGQAPVLAPCGLPNQTRRALNVLQVLLCVPCSALFFLAHDVEITGSEAGWVIGDKLIDSIRKVHQALRHNVAFVHRLWHGPDIEHTAFVYYWQLEIERITT